MAVKYNPKKTTQQFNAELDNFANLSIKNITNVVKVKSKLANQYETFDGAFSQMEAKINSFQLFEDQKSEIYNTIRSILQNFVQLILVSCDSHLDDKCSQTLETKITTVFGHFDRKIMEINTAYKRKKKLTKNKNIKYVEPIEKAIGLKWRTKLSLKIDLPDYTIGQLTFQYIPVVDSIKSWFAQEEFKKNYFDFNSSENHVCQRGVYKHFCCSDTRKNYEIFEDQNAMKIRLAFDDVDVCEPVKSKSVIHKLTCVYATIENMPEKYLSKTNNMFLVALCETSNLKAPDNTFDEIAELIVNDLQQLENVGIEVDGKTIKGSLVRLVSDNLGANGAVGLVESFNSYFCRICEVSKEESQKLVVERQEIMRTKESYQKCVEVAENLIQQGKAIDFKATKGVKRACIFNNLQNFHFLDNPTLDVMHDVNEGLIPFFLIQLFDYCEKEKIIKKVEIQRLVRDHIYGLLYKRNKPSKINFDRSNLGQNATQLHTIMIHLPFILADYKEKLKDIWGAAESLLMIMQIVYSYEICDDDIDRLTSYIKTHYQYLINVFQVTLLPKHHNVLHYPNAIRKTGPIILSWMMRFEAKHQFFTNAAKKTNCFINIAKTLAKKHQEAMSYNEYQTDTLERSKINQKFIKYSRYAEFKDVVSAYVTCDHEKLEVLHFAKFNCFEYREGLMIMSNHKLFEIEIVLSNDEQIWFLCQPYNVKRFDSFHNSIEVERASISVSEFSLFELTELKNPKSYERKISKGVSFIICDTLDFKCFQ